MRERREPLAPRDVAGMLLALADSVAFLHARGIVHRDLKPGNILLQEGNHETHERHEKKTEEKATADKDSPSVSFSCVSWFTPKITDFGLAKDLQASHALTRSGAVLGTLRYMAPEQADARRADVGSAADVYAVGAIFYELLTGRPPFQGVTEADLLRQVLHDEPMPPWRLRANVPRDLETICLKCLEKEPRRRFAGAAVLADDLRRFLEGRPIQARPARLWERAWKWARRRLALAGLLAVLALSLAGFVVGTAAYIHALSRHGQEMEDPAARERQQRLRAERLVYAAQLRQAAQAVQDGKLVAAVERLDALRPQPDADDLRGFEWHYLKGLCWPLRAV